MSQGINNDSISADSLPTRQDIPANSMEMGINVNNYMSCSVVVGENHSRYIISRRKKDVTSSWISSNLKKQKGSEREDELFLHLLRLPCPRRMFPVCAGCSPSSSSSSTSAGVRLSLRLLGRLRRLELILLAESSG